MAMSSTSTAVTASFSLSQRCSAGLTREQVPALPRGDPTRCEVSSSRGFGAVSVWVYASTLSAMLSQ